MLNVTLPHPHPPAAEPLRRRGHDLPAVAVRDVNAMRDPVTVPAEIRQVYQPFSPFALIGAMMQI